MSKDKKAYVELRLAAKEKESINVEDELNQKDPEREEAEAAILKSTSSIIKSVN
jgi:hypothetical protein